MDMTVLVKLGVDRAHLEQVFHSIGDSADLCEGYLQHTVDDIAKFVARLQEWRRPLTGYVNMTVLILKAASYSIGLLQLAQRCAEFNALYDRRADEAQLSPLLDEIISAANAFVTGFRSHLRDDPSP